MSQQLTLKQHLSARTLSAAFSRNRYNPQHRFAVERDYALTIIEGNAKLLACTPDSVGRCILDIGVLGVSLSPNRKEAYLIPYKNTTTNQTICTLSVSYMGMEQIAYRTGMVANIQTVLVHNADTFRVFTANNQRQIEHEEKTSNRGKVTHAYCIATYANGTTYVEVMDRVQIDGVKAAATKKNNGTVPFTWNQNNPFRYEMYRKAVLRRAWKHFPKSESKEMSKITEVVQRTDPVDFTPVARKEEKVGETSVTLSHEQVDELIWMMKEAKVKKELYDRQLLSLAKALGYRNIEAVSAADFEKAKTTLETGLAKFVERTQGSQ